MLYDRRSVSQGFQRTIWKFYEVMEEPLLFELRELFPASYPELTTQGHLLHAMSLGSPRSEGGKNSSLVCSYPQMWPPTNISSRETRSYWNPGYNIYLKYFALFVWYLQNVEHSMFQFGLICYFFPLRAIHACAEWEYKALTN